ncbi:GlsB/YeaQ/YmgE family stress response membrane protein [Gemmatimonas sp.]|uniref:GlsB/YeaQ/YmgE family stress response membrane protein n=1 Tax=Gemmatimonas sp. TaxID=1962908 RepID=UPI0033407DA5
MSLLWTALIGLIAGALAKAIMPGRDPGGIIITMLLGVAGAMLGTFLGRAVGWYQPGEAAGLIAAIVGAVLLLFIYRSFRGRSSVA